ncbi:uncharacterized protein F54H12.2-like [Cephus cinctus]|uniref:Uncharacterized protein F54H12.2-like n=1 Tax=Cephus cinctus TaxID=211228 RepID=A0AAJ7CEL7_CEPCN|nr:uncharacterized protein F54H12.2-like [Cephus cinctus]
MAFLHAHSCEGMKSELEFFTLPPTQITIESVQWVHYTPISSLADDSPIKLFVPGNGDEYLDLAHTMLSLRVQLRFKDTLAPDVLSKAAPVNNLLHSLFNQVDVFLNQKLVSPPNNAYAYRAYIETLLNYGPAAKRSHLSSMLRYDDTPGHMDHTAGKNTNLANSLAFVGRDRAIDLIGHLHCDVFNQETFLLNGVELRLQLVRTRDGFSLMDPKSECSLHITEATLLVRCAKMSPGILLAHSRMLSKTTAKYPLTGVEVKALTLHAGLHGSTMDNVIFSQLPKRIIIVFVDNKAFNGNYQLNPFKFKNYCISF